MRKANEFTRVVMSGRSLFLAVLLSFLTQHSFAGTWVALSNSPSIFPSVMLILTDGTVFATDGYSCERLTPDSHGSYVNGTWTHLAHMNYSRGAFGSCMLRDGRVFVAGGEYGNGSNTAEVYDPKADSWTVTPTPLSINIADGLTKLLPDGNVLVAPVYPGGGGTMIYETASNTWLPYFVPLVNNNYDLAEASWVRLADGSILAIDFDLNSSERFIPAQTNWVADSYVPSYWWGSSEEEGAAILLPNGKAIFFAATGHTEIYTPSGSTSPGTWQAGPNFPNGQGTPDAPAAMMVNGKILCAVSPIPAGYGDYPSPTSFYEYDWVSNAFTQVNGPTGPTLGGSPDGLVMLDLPDGTILMNGTSVYQPDGPPLASGKPAVSSISPNPDGTFHLVGTLLNGISEGAGYGDDAQMDSNYPLIRMTNRVTGVVYYARTFNWGNIAVMTGTNPVSTEFAAPPGLPPGIYQLVVSANGNPSDFVLFGYPDALTIYSTVGFTGYGPVGGPFSPSAQYVTIFNGGTSDLNWSSIINVPWLTVWPPSGTIGVNGNMTVSVSINSNANTLPLGFYPGTVLFTNLNDGYSTSVQFGLGVISPPVITSSPTSQAVPDGGTATFTVGASGGQPMWFEWLFNGSVLTDNGHTQGTSTSTLTINNVTSADVGTYQAIAFNPVGSATSCTATLTIAPYPPVIIQQPVGATVYAGTPVQLSVYAAGSKPFSYQWTSNGIPIAGATSSTLILSNPQPSQSGNYAVVVANSLGSATSAAAVVTILAPPPCSTPSGLVGWWRFNGNSSDFLGLDNVSLTTNPTSIHYVAGEVGQAVNFDGTFIGIVSLNGNTLNVGAGNGLTFECWIKPADLIPAEPLLQWYAYNPNGHPGVQLWINQNGPGSLYADLIDTSFADHIVYSAAGYLNTNQFQHVALTYDKASGLASLYWNGTQVASSSLGTFTPLTTTLLYMAFANSTYYHGVMDEPALYNRALSATEIQALYNSSFVGKCVPYITQQPQNVTVPAGNPATFSVAARPGSGSLTYQWLFNGSPIPNATNASYTIPSALPVNQGQYSVVISDATSSTTSAAATLTVTTGSIAASGYHSVALKHDGTVWSWGNNDYGEVGDGTQTARSVPTQSTGLAGSPQQVVNLTGMTMVAAGTSHSLGLGSDGTIWAWGFNNWGQVGGPIYTYSVQAITRAVQVYSGTVLVTNVSFIAAGGANSYAVLGDGTVWAWGYNGYGQLGYPPSYTSYRPFALPVPGISGIRSIAAGTYHVLALTTNGLVYSWGYNSNGQLGNGTLNQSSIPTLVPGLSNIVQVAAGNNTSYALDNQGVVWVWGINSAGQLGIGTLADSYSPVQNTNLIPMPMSDICSGYNHAFALGADGRLWGWGVDSQGSLGDGSTTNVIKSTPIQVTFPDNTVPAGLSAGSLFTLSIQTDGTLRSWGFNYYGQLGNNSTTKSLVPGPVQGP